MGADDQWIVTAMMPHQHRHARGFRSSHQLANFVHVHAHRFFQQHRHASREAIQSGADVQGIRVGDDHCVRLHLLEHLTVIGEMRHAPLRGIAAACGPGSATAHKVACVRVFR